MIRSVFKKGDRVRLLIDIGKDLRKGCYGLVVDVESSNYDGTDYEDKFLLSVAFPDLAGKLPDSFGSWLPKGIDLQGHPSNTVIPVRPYEVELIPLTKKPKIDTRGSN